MIIFSKENINTGDEMLHWAKQMWPFNRSLTGEGNRKTLKFIKSVVPKLKIKGVKSGTKVFDWTVPKEWEIKDAYISDLNGNKVCDFKKNNLSVVGYSEKISCTLPLKKLKKNIYTLKNQPDYIPYVTSYYKKSWGFCMSHKQLKKLPDKNYNVLINSRHFSGEMNYGEILIKGKSKKEIMFSTNICHPSMANNELSGITLNMALAKYLIKKKNLNYSYRLIFIPETIGSIYYIKKNYKQLKNWLLCGFVLSCVGDERSYSIINSRYKNNLSEKILEVILKNKKNLKKYSFLDRGSDERQFCSALTDLPFCGFSKSKYGEYPEYHTSADNFNIVTAKGLQESFNVFTKVIEGMELSYNKPKAFFKCEPFMGKRNLYNTISSKLTSSRSDIKMKNFRLNLDVLCYADGKNDIFDICNYVKASFEDVFDSLIILKKNKLLE